MSLMLSEIPLNDMLPREYNMQITNRESTNTFVFTEHDLPGFSQRGRVVNNSGGATSQPFSQAAPRVPFSNRSKLGLASKVEKSWKRGSNFRKGIPSKCCKKNITGTSSDKYSEKTALVGHVRTELNCLPVENEQYRHIMDERARAELKPKRETQYLGKGTAGGNSLNPGTLGQSGSFDNFIKPTGNQRTKGQDSKAARMPQNELLDLIYECFKKYNYWPLKSLKNELNQPEAYLKQTLEMVGELVRQGPHAMTWKLRADSKPSDFAELQSFDQARDQAPDTNATYDGASSHGDMASEDEDGNVKMEDVMA
jgi:transcription initiation factor TFIIF subunit beta